MRVSDPCNKDWRFAGTTLITGVLTEVAPAGMPLSGPDKCKDLRLRAPSMEEAGSALTDPLAMGMSGPLVSCGTAT